jgi:hypothetical protein
MRYRLAALCLLAGVLCVAAPLPAFSAMGSPTVGVGPHGYDFLIGTWTCKNNAPSAMSGPTVVTLSVARSVNGALAFHSSGSGFAAMGYVVYDPKSKTWWNPSTTASGAYGTETSQGTGKKTTWSGPFTDPSSGKTMQVRDTYTFANPTTYTDLFQVESGGSWKTQGDSTCTKS